MKYLLFFCGCFLALNATAQDTTKAKPKAYLGVLTLVEKFKEEKNWTTQDQAIVGDHFKRLVKMKNEGIVVLAGRTELDLKDPEMMGLVVFYAKDDKEALQFMLDDPAVKNNIMRTKVHPYGLAISKCN